MNSVSIKIKDFLKKPIFLSLFCFFLGLLISSLFWQTRISQENDSISLEDANKIANPQTTPAPVLTQKIIISGYEITFNGGGWWYFEPLQKGQILLGRDGDKDCYPLVKPNEYEVGLQDNESLGPCFFSVAKREGTTDFLIKIQDTQQPIWKDGSIIFFNEKKKINNFNLVYTWQGTFKDDNPKEGIIKSIDEDGTTYVHYIAGCSEKICLTFDPPTDFPPDFLVEQFEYFVKHLDINKVK